MRCKPNLWCIQFATDGTGISLLGKILGKCVCHEQAPPYSDVIYIFAFYIRSIEMLQYTPACPRSPPEEHIRNLVPRFPEREFGRSI